MNETFRAPANGLSSVVRRTYRNRIAASCDSVVSGHDICQSPVARKRLR